MDTHGFARRCLLTLVSQTSPLCPREREVSLKLLVGFAEKREGGWQFRPTRWDDAWWSLVVRISTGVEAVARFFRGYFDNDIENGWARVSFVWLSRFPLHRCTRV